MQKQNFQPMENRRRQLFEYQRSKLSEVSAMSSDLYSTQETARYKILKSMPTKNPNFVKIFKPSSVMSATELTAGNESVRPHSRKFGCPPSANGILTTRK